MPFNFQVCFGAGGGSSSPLVVWPNAGVDGTVDGAVDGALPVEMPTAGGGQSGAGGTGGNSRPLSAPGGEVLGVGALEASGEDTSVFLWWCTWRFLILGDFERSCCSVDRWFSLSPDSFLVTGGITLPSEDGGEVIELFGVPSTFLFSRMNISLIILAHWS